MLKKIYLEICNCCNLSCSFCHGTARKPRMMSAAEFEEIVEAIRGRAEFLYFHLMGEPLLHPELPGFIVSAAGKGFRPVVTTNGTLLPERREELLCTPLYKVNISLHAAEANTGIRQADYLENCVNFAHPAASGGILTVFRLWNIGGQEENNNAILDALKEAYPQKWEKTRIGFRLADRTFLEFGERFEWPDISADEYGEELFCWGLRDQVGILCDGSVVPCCLDADGVMTLGNLFREDLDTIFSSERARRIYDGFSAHKAVEELCRKCGYAAVTKKHRARG